MPGLAAYHRFCGALVAFYYGPSWRGEPSSSLDRAQDWRTIVDDRALSVQRPHGRPCWRCGEEVQRLHLEFRPLAANGARRVLPEPPPPAPG